MVYLFTNPLIAFYFYSKIHKKVFLFLNNNSILLNLNKLRRAPIGNRAISVLNGKKILVHAKYRYSILKSFFDFLKVKTINNSLK